MHRHLQKLTGAAFAAGLLLTTPLAWASGSPTYHVTITNLTNSIIFTPILVASHRNRADLFDLGTPASDDLAAVAEGGDTSGLEASLNAMSHVVDVQSSGAPLPPGDSVTVILSASHGARRISVASMMLPTNDGFIALDGERVPRHGLATFFSPGYDAGSEPNDELCDNIPGPVCGGAGGSPVPDPADEGYVHIHRGTHGIGDLEPHIYDWRNPVARITVRRMSH